mgnify:CR=1 FL=1
MKIKIKKVYLGVDICVIITYISIKLNKPMEKQMQQFLVKQKVLDDMNNHIAELEQILIKNYESLPYEVREQLKPYLWSK